MSIFPSVTHRVGVAALTISLLAAGCGSDEDDGPSAADKSEAVATYAEGVHAAYGASVDSATVMDTAIDAFLADPTASTLQAAKDAWLDARDDYGPTEAFRFYDGPIDNPEDGPEGLINAWPMDESYVDYVEGAPDAGIINDAEGFPVIDAELLLSLNEQGGETNISTGWHAIEFLLWGQDLSLDGPGARPVEDFTSAPNADRRGTYLAVATDLLVGHLEWLRDSWAPDADNFRADFVAGDADDALTDIITGIGELSRGELAGERMNVAYSERSQEDEHSCFSDNTTADIVGNARGIEMVLTASYPGGVTGTSILDLVAAADAELASRLETEVDASLSAVRAIPAPFDRHLVDGVSDDDPGRASILTAIELLETQTDTIVAAATAVGASINVS
ncbi:MAG: lipoprotein precursor [Acidimicrobiales bacterium]|nr:MAG: lipoprotein precursor [Acidimicrobiales bacterium]